MSHTSTPVIVAEHLRKSYPLYPRKKDRLLEALDPFRRKRHTLFHALSDVSFSVDKGECVGVIGVNGAGKSTLLKILTGVLTPSGGHLHIQGRTAALLELGAGFHPERTGIENIYYQGAIQGLAKDEVDAYIQAVISFADIGEFIHQPVKMYSSGMFVRLAFAAAIQGSPDILIVDEALSVGDVFFVQKCMAFLRAYMEEHTVIFVSHDIAAVKALCDRVIFLEKGRVRMIAPPEEAAQAYIEAIYREQGADTESARHKAAAASAPHAAPPPVYRDMRLDFLNTTSLRNDIELFTFNADADSFGSGGATLESVLLTDMQDQPLSWVVGGEEVRLTITGRAHQDLYSPIVGFFLKDRLGQDLFGDNTYLRYCDTMPLVPAGCVLRTSFTFCMPVLPAGEYVMTVALAEGTQARHVQLCWTHNALVLHSHSTSCSTGLVGLPMRDIVMEVEKG